MANQGVRDRYRVYRAFVVAVLGVGALLVGCGSEPRPQPAPAQSLAGNPIIVGTTEGPVHLDPVSGVDRGSLLVQHQIFPLLMSVDDRRGEVVPDLAESAGFTATGQYRVTLPPGVRFANGHELTSADVKFSLERTRALADPQGVAAGLSAIARIDTPNNRTIVFTLTRPGDESFPFLLASAAAMIVDEEVLSRDAPTSDRDIIEGGPFAGPYVISSWESGAFVEFTPNENYRGLLPGAENSGVILASFADTSNLEAALAQGDVDVALFGSASPGAGEERARNVLFVSAPAGQVLSVTFGAQTVPAGASPEQGLAVRQAVADLVDRNALATGPGRGEFLPLFSFVPEGLSGATEVLKDLYGDGAGGPAPARAAARLEAAGVPIPVAITLLTRQAQPGVDLSQTASALAGQLRGSGLFTVTVDDSEGEGLPADAGSYGMTLQEIPAAFVAEAYLAAVREEDAAPEDESAATPDATPQTPAAPDAGSRRDALALGQQWAGENLPAIALLQAVQSAGVRDDVQGLVLQASFPPRLCALTR